MWQYNYTPPSISNELYHYGVLGMKWGTRNIRSTTNNRKIGYGDDVQIKKGAKVYRISANKKDIGDTRYATVDGNDRNFYKAMWPGTLKGQAGAINKKAPIYEQKYRATENLISPSAKMRQKIAAELSENPEIQSEIAKSIIARRFSRTTGKSISEMNKSIDYAEATKDQNYLQIKKNIVNDIKDFLDNASEGGKASYFLGAMGNSDRVRYEFGKAIVNKGYNMIIDDHGADFAGNKQRVNSPIILLKAETTLKQIGSKRVSDFTSQRAMIKYDADMSTISGKQSESVFVPNVIKKYYNHKNYYYNNTSDYIYDNNGNKITK